jgi:hypothetical protein
MELRPGDHFPQLMVKAAKSESPMPNRIVSAVNRP